MLGPRPCAQVSGGNSKVWNRKLIRKLYHIEGYELLHQLLCDLGKPFDISEPRFPELLNEKFRENDLQDHLSSNI